MYKKSICEYGVSVDAKEVFRLTEEFSVLAHDWRGRLGTKQGLLDKYLYGVLTALSEAMNTSSIIEIGFEETMPELRGLCKHIKEGSNSGLETHPFFPVLERYTDTYAIPFDPLFYESCCVGTFAEYTAFSLHQLTEYYDGKLRERLEKEGLPEMRETLLRAEVGITANDVDNLLERLIKLFVLVSPATVFLQCMAEQVIMSLLLQDKLTGDYVFQCLLNGEI